MFRSLIFEDAPGPPSAPNRVDIALFVGFCAARPSAGAPLDRPVLCDSWGDFDRRFDWDARTLNDTTLEPVVGSTYLGAAVRSFFAQGGRRCYVVCAGAPNALTLSYAQRLARVDTLIPGYTTGFFDFSPLEASSWRGAWWLWDLPDVAFVCLPDLADLLRMEPRPDELEADGSAPLLREQFVECSLVEAPPPRDTRARLISAPRADEIGYRDWARAVRMVGLFLRAYRPDVQLVAALPMPADELGSTLLHLLDDSQLAPLRYGLDDSGTGIASAWVQLAYPWLRTSGSGRLPEQLESPDGVLVGMLARNALTRGTFRSAVKQTLVDVYDVAPALRNDELFRHSDPRRKTLIERVSLFGRAVSQLALLSDVTADLEESYRPASINRLLALLLREARRLGDDVVFEASSEVVWAQLRAQIEALLRALYAIGALNGPSEVEAFQVRCDRRTMTQSDLDSGRLICSVTFAPAAPIEQIRVVLALNQGGMLSLLPG
jgi:hypothetical protein